MKTINKNALKLYDYALENGLAKTQGELSEKIGLVASNLYDIKSGKRSFTHEQIHALASLTNADMNFIYGFSKNMFRVDEKMSGMKLLQKAVAVLKAEGK